MDYKTVTFVFPRPLTPIQKNLFISVFQELRDKLKERLKKAIKNLRSGWVQTLSGATATLYATNLETLEGNIDSVLILENPKPGEYVFKIAYKMFKALDMATPAVLGEKAQFWNKLQEKVTGEFRNKLCRQMGFNPNEVKVTFGEEATETPNL